MCYLASHSSQTGNKRLLKLPPVLVFNCGLNTRAFWNEQLDGTMKRVPLNMSMSVSGNGELVVESLDASEENEQVSSSQSSVSFHILSPLMSLMQIRTYELVAMVALVKESGSTHPGNLVAHIRVGESYHERKGIQSPAQWYLFNNIAIEAIPDVSWVAGVLIKQVRMCCLPVE